MSTLLTALIPSAHRPRVYRLLQDLLQTEALMVQDTQGQVLLGQAVDAPGVPLNHELETIGYLHAAAADPGRLALAGRWLEMLMEAWQRYLLAAELQQAVVEADYEELQQQNAQLQASEARYRTLAAELEQRVVAQVRVLEAAQQQLFQAEKLAAVGRLAAGVAHEINNPLGFIGSNLASAQKYLARLQSLGAAITAKDWPRVQLLWESGDLDFVLADFASLTGESQEGVARVARIVADLKAFSHVDRAEEAIVDLNDHLKSTAKMLAGALLPTQHFELKLGALPPVLCLPGHINQALSNILQNACQATAARADGVVRIESLTAGQDACIKIIDNGGGMDEATRQRAFDPFFSTRGVGGGTGLGLSVARDVILTHGGRIEIDSLLGTGTTVTLWLPGESA